MTLKIKYSSRPRRTFIRISLNKYNLKNLRRFRGFHQWIKKISNNLKYVYKLHLIMKQKLRRYYGNLRENQFKKLYKLALSYKGHPVKNFFKLLEKRLETLLCRSYFSYSIYNSRQLINHGHILVNGKTIKNSNYILKYGDLIQINEIYLQTLGNFLYYFIKKKLLKSKSKNKHKTHKYIKIKKRMKFRKRRRKWFYKRRSPKIIIKWRKKIKFKKKIFLSTQNYKKDMKFYLKSNDSYNTLNKLELHQNLIKNNIIFNFINASQFIKLKEKMNHYIKIIQKNKHYYKENPVIYKNNVQPEKISQIYKANLLYKLRKTMYKSYKPLINSKNSHINKIIFYFNKYHLLINKYKVKYKYQINYNKYLFRNIILNTYHKKFIRLNKMDTLIKKQLIRLKRYKIKRLLSNLVIPPYLLVNYKILASILITNPNIITIPYLEPLYFKSNIYRRIYKNFY